MFQQYKPLTNNNNTEKYSINLMWINRKLDETKPYISTHESKEKLIEMILIKALKWEQANPEAEVAIWYDSQFVTPKAIENTKLVLEEIPNNKIMLKDIRTLNVVNHNPDAFSDNIPVYYRVDLLKFIICVHAIDFDANQTAIFSDLEVGDLRASNDRMNKEALFNPATINRLNKIGIQFKQAIGIENQFIQVFNKKTTTDAIKIYINAWLVRAVTALNLETEDQRQRFIPELCCGVFNTMHTQLFSLIAMGAYDDIKILIDPALFPPHNNGEWIEYNFAEHGCRPLGNFYTSRYPTLSFHLDGLNATTNSATLVDTNIKLPELSVPILNSFARRDLETRGPAHHIEYYTDLVPRTPADGSKTYKMTDVYFSDQPKSKPMLNKQ